MAQDITNIANSIPAINTIGEGKNPENIGSVKVTPPVVYQKVPIETDPKVCHDPSLKIEGIARLYSSQNKVEMEDGELSTNNKYDALRTDGILYPLVVINDRNVENHDILSMTIGYDDFLPYITITVHDGHEAEQKINSSQMSGLIRVAMISPVDNVYKKILINFKISSAKVDPHDTTIVKYFGEFNVPGFKQINMGHIWMPIPCPKPITCQQGGHINANTWEMLHEIAGMSGLGFAATKQCKEIPDHVVRNIYSQRYDQYIKQQLLHCGTSEDDLFDAWVDLYGYIVMINVPWVLRQTIDPEDLGIVANAGIHGTSNDLPDQEPINVERTLTNYNLIGAITNLEIQSYNMIISNNSVEKGTLEHVFMYKFDKNKTVMDELDVQTKQNSIDGQFLEDYNTGKNRPIPKYDFNDPKYTGLEGGYDLNEQKTIRTAFFRKHRQQILEIVLKNLNFGLQRGTLVNVTIFDNDPVNKRVTFENVSNLMEPNDEIEEDATPLPDEINKEDINLDDGAYMPNMKLSGLYYIDGMRFEYSPQIGKINQILLLFKKGSTSGYGNKHTTPKVPDKRTPNKPTIPQSAPFIFEY